MVGPASKILITGGLGYVGGRIATHLASCAPNLSLRLMTRRTEERIPEWAQGLEVVRGEVLQTPSLDAALDGVDTVIHLAAVNEIESQRDPDLALQVNGVGTQRLLEACRSRGVKRFIYFSTFHVYGPGAPRTITEETPTRPIHPYAITHRLAEDLVNWHRHSYGMETLVLRLSNGFGYPADPLVQRWTLVFNDLCLQAVRDGVISLRSGGSQHRDFVSLGDIARGVQHFLALPPAKWGDGLFNFGGECSLSILEVAQRVASEYFNRYSKEVPIRTGEAAEPPAAGPLVYSIRRLKQTGFVPGGDMSREIQGTLDLCWRLVSRPGREG